MLARFATGLTLCLSLATAGDIGRASPGSLPSPPPASPRKDPPLTLKFAVKVPEGRLPGPVDGRLFLIFAPRTGTDEPRHRIGDTGLNRPPMLARDVHALQSGDTVTIGQDADAFPIDSLASLRPDEYRVQAVFDFNPDIRSPNAPGNLASRPINRVIEPARDQVIPIALDEIIPDDTPTDTRTTRFLKLESHRLSAFHGRPIFLRAALILPDGFDQEPDRRYPLRVHIGGFGARYYQADRQASASGATRFLTLVLDGAGPLGDPYQVNSANHGPFGDAITQELIPHVEKTYRGIGNGQSRVLDGGSTGGWVSLALQVFYPDFFNGCWSFCPDAVDFRDFQLVNIYRDSNAFVNAHGFERPAARDRNGDVRYTMRHEVSLENTLGRGHSWALSGGQWGSWNATYGPRGANGRPVPLWDPQTGAIDPEVAQHWEQHDLRRLLDKNWATLGPKLRGKIHIWVGEADDYFLNNAVHRLDDFLSRANPPADAVVAFGPGQGHCWMGISRTEMLRQMALAVNGGR